jgi:hypothetical protein
MEGNNWTYELSEIFTALTNPLKWQKIFPLKERIEKAINKRFYQAVRWINEDLTNDQIFSLLGNNPEGNKPQDFRDRNMRTGDIILDNENIYYCDSIGFKKVEQ